MIDSCNGRSSLSSRFSLGQLAPAQLAAEVQRLTSSPAEGVARVRLDPEGRWYERMHMADDFEVWLISWLPGQSTGFHDHGGRAARSAWCWASWTELAPGGRRETHAPG